MITDKNSKEVSQSHFSFLVAQLEAQRETMNAHKNVVMKLEAKYEELRTSTDAFIVKHGDGCGFADAECSSLAAVVERHKIKEIREKKS